MLDGLRRLRLGGLQKLVLQLMATKVNDASIQEETERLFSSLDVRQDGVVRKAEIDEARARDAARATPRALSRRKLSPSPLSASLSCAPARVRR